MSDFVSIVKQYQQTKRVDLLRKFSHHNTQKQLRGVIRLVEQTTKHRSKNIYFQTLQRQIIKQIPPQTTKNIISTKIKQLKTIKKLLAQQDKNKCHQYSQLWKKVRNLRKKKNKQIIMQNEENQGKIEASQKEQRLSDRVQMMDEKDQYNSTQISKSFDANFRSN